MSHFTYSGGFEAVGTRHDDIYVGLGYSADGHESIGLVITADENVDVHLSPEHAEELCRVIADHVTAIAADS